MKENKSNLLSKIPYPEKETDESLARGLVEMVLNRHIAALEDAGYKKPKKLKGEFGWINGKPGKLLQLKFDLIDEAIQIFTPEILEELRKRNEYQ